jgi:uncharacterized protein with PIN domain
MARRVLAFACDEMLGRLARYLRAAGYDTTIAHDGARDAEILAQARSESRTLLTRDRGIAEHAAARGIAIVLPAADLDRSAAFLRDDLGVDWLYRPFTRCLVDNAPLISAPAWHREALPRDVDPADALHCPRCGRSYWAGSHHRRMLARLRAWASWRASWPDKKSPGR